MPTVYLLVLLIWALVATRTVLFWVYLWQLKEYRLDRFWTEYGSYSKLVRFWAFSGGRQLRRPRFTAKAVLISVFSLAVVLMTLGLPIFNSPSLVSVFLYLLVVYLFIPPIVLLVIFLFKIPTSLVKQSIYRRAGKKIAGIKNLTVIGITGSYGKSSTKEFLAQILSQKFKIAKTPENVNSEIGIANFILKNQFIDVRRRYMDYPEIFIVEMGAYRIGEIKRICDIVKPKIGILTGINEQHLALFDSLENIKKAKFELIESLPQNGLAVFNGENKYTSELAEKCEGKKIIYRHKDFPVNIPNHYKLNLTAACEVAKYLGMTDEEIGEATREIGFTSKMLKTYTGRNKILIIDDTYSANPDGVLAALDYLGSRLESTKIIIMPCLIELGRAASAVHQKIGRKIKDVCDLAIVITPDYFKDIKKEAGGKVVLMENSNKIREFLEKKLNANSVILLEGRIPQNIIDIVNPHT